MPEITFDPGVYYRVLAIYFLLINGIGFAFFWMDKTYARKGLTRIPEIRMLLIGIFGPIGALISMLYFRHKIRKPKFFAVLIPAAVAHLYLLKFLIFLIQ